MTAIQHARPYRRKMSLIKRDLQLKVVFYMFLCTRAILAIHSWALMVLVKFADVSRGSVDAKRTFYTILLVDLGITLVFMAALSFAVGILFSHRFAGPIYRFEQTLKKVGIGDVSDRVHLRKGDLLKDFCDTMNESLAGLRGFVQEDRRLLDDAVERLTRLRGKVQDPLATREIEAIRATLGEVRAKFRVEPPPPDAPAELPEPVPAAAVAVAKA